MGLGGYLASNPIIPATGDQYAAANWSMRESSRANDPFCVHPFAGATGLRT
jgi:hypothetical protein